MQAGLEQGTSAINHCSAKSQADTVLGINMEGKINSGSKEICTGLDEFYYPA